MIHEPWYLEPGGAPSKRAILRAALRLFASQGIASTSVREIAAEAGYTNPALYRFFQGKMELAGFLFDRCYSHLRTEIRAAAGTSDRPPSVRLAGLVHAYAQLLEEDLEAVVFVHEALRSFWRPDEGQESIFGIVREILGDAVREGEMDAGSPVPLFATVVVGALAQFARSIQFGEIPAPARAHARSLEGALRRAVGMR